MISLKKDCINLNLWQLRQSFLKQWIECYCTVLQRQPWIAMRGLRANPTQTRNLRLMLRSKSSYMAFINIGTSNHLSRPLTSSCIQWTAVLESDKILVGSTWLKRSNKPCCTMNETVLNWYFITSIFLSNLFLPFDHLFLFW